MIASRFKTWEVLAFLLLAAACFGVIFLRLGFMPIMLWDEGSFAVTALEMSENGKYFASYYDGKPDFILNFKPHLNVWAQVLCFKLFGYNEIALRIPAAICASITVFSLFTFIRRYSGCLTAAAAASLTLLCSYGYILDHCARTGDTDAMLVMWLTLAALRYFDYTEKLLKKDLWLFFLFFFLAALTKGISAFLILPGLFIYSLVKGKLLLQLKDKTLYLGALLTILLIAGYYWLRELYVPGYFSTMFNSELGRFWNKDLEGAVHHQPFAYYIQLLWDSYFSPWIYFIIPAYLFVRFSKAGTAFRNLADFSLIYALSHLLIISVSKTKLPWYPAPEYPMFAILIGLTVASLERFEFSGRIPAYVKALLLLLVFFIPYKREVVDIIAQKTEWHAVQYSRYIRKIHAMHPETPLFVSDLEMNSHLVFFSRVLPKEGISLENVHAKHKFRPDNVIITCNPALQDSLKERYPVKVLDQEFRCSCMQIEGEEREAKKANEVHIP
jgi:4-amino-4-deoxy-L-arabinose transferase-like glycosyltransferase